MSTVRIDLDEVRLKRRLSGNADNAQKVLDLQVMKDCEPYVPADTMNLTRSAQRASDIGSGVVKWDGPYAAAQYYHLPSKSHNKHPLAVMRWFEAAKAVRKAVWLRVAKNAGGGR